jgi:hypothetical protein
MNGVCLLLFLLLWLLLWMLWLLWLLLRLFARQLRLVALGMIADRLTSIPHTTFHPTQCFNFHLKQLVVSTHIYVICAAQARDCRVMLLRLLGGMTHLNKKLKCQEYISKHQHDRALMIELSERIATDRRCEVSDDAAPTLLEEWAAAGTIQNRGIYEALLHMYRLWHFIVRYCLCGCSSVSCHIERVQACSS